MKKTIFSLIILSFLFGIGAKAQDRAITPTETFMFAERDTCNLFLDYYRPETGVTAKPTIVFAFGGGFINGSKDDAFYLKWFKELVDRGYTVVSIDYRLGLKDQKKIRKTSIKPVEKAIKLATEDMISALAFLDANAEELGIDPTRIVLSGSSAGAITALQTEFEIYNRTPLASELRPDFTLGGVMAFAGAVFSRKGSLSYKERPCPTQMYHGVNDKLVEYDQIRFFNIGLYGSSRIAQRMNKFGYNYQCFRYLGYGHEISSIMDRTVDRQVDFLENCVVKGQKKVIDINIDDPTIEHWKDLTVKDLTK
ncbi:MAG: alpha/beta hydrolase [Bacteroidales bacterium]|nr:alpha/beta hydrolase [Bacteroidales bacterium]